jgi:hypothetical protein
MSLDKDNFKAAIARAEAAERKLRDTQKLTAVRVNPATEEQLADRHLINIQDPPNKVTFNDVDGVGKCTILSDDDRPELGLAYQFKDGWWGRCTVFVWCVGYQHYSWDRRDGTKQVFKGKLAKEIKFALQALHIRTRAKGPM